MKKEVLSFFLFLMFACACPFKAMAENVSSADELVAIANQYAATAGADEKNITLTADIDLDGVKWIPIGTKDKPFKGTFNGQGHTIKGFRAFEATDGVGLFGYIAKTGVVENLGISGGSLIAKNKRRIGAIAGVCDGTIRKCWSMAFIPVAGNVVGGLVGELTSNGIIEDCYQSGLILNAADTIGAIVGRNSGKLTRVFNVGYAKNGNAIVGLDVNGTYSEVYFDRKLYYQKSGLDGDAIIGYDITENMFSLFNDNAAWSVADNRYPILKQFASTNAAKLSAAPMFIEAGDIDPVNHANDLTNNFTVSVEGSITWACQDESDKQWIQISGKDVVVVRPCTETDVLVDSKLGADVRVVYMRPRRVEDLLAGTFVSYDDETGVTGGLMGYCFDSYWELPTQSRVELASRGWLGEGGDYHYKVEFYSINDLNGDTTLINTLLPDAKTSEYRTWYEKFVIPTDAAGHFLIRSWVHDNGCVTDWVENKTGFEFVVFGEFVPGEIVTKIDTILLNETRVFVNAQSKSESYGGGGPVYYQWLLNGDTIPGQVGLNLVNYPITQPGVYTFTRQTRDSICYVPQSSVEYLGKYIVYVFDKFDPGEITDRADTSFCSVEDALTYVVQATSASGGVSSKGYNYQWYFKNGDVLIKINGATNQTLALSGLTLEAGHDYTFVREAEDKTRFTTLTRSRYEKKIHIMASLTPGAIENATWETFCFEANDNKLTPHTIIIHETTPATCSDGGVVYEWIMNPGNKVVGQNAELEYTFMMGEIKLGQTYTFTRQVRNSNPDCDWVPSTGTVTQKYGKKTYHEITTVVCANDIPFVMTLEDGKSHVFNSATDVWTVTDESGDCPDITDYKIELATMPNFQLDEYVSWCQTSGTMSVYYVEDPGAPSNVFNIRYSEDLAKYMGAKDTTGVITTPGTILFENMPNLGTGDLYLNVQIGYQAESASGVCYSTSHLMRLYPSLGGYVYSKYDRVVFVDNNPDNGALPDATEKLEFVSYQWYKNGLLQEGETGQYYHEGGALLEGVFYCMLKDTKGNTYRTCDIKLPEDGASAAPQNTAVYPVPVGAGELLSIEAFGAAQIVSLAGERITNIESIDSKVDVSAPRIPGIYFVRITTEDGVVETHKLIVK